MDALKTESCWATPHTDKIQDMVKEIGRYAYERNVVFAVEPNPPIYGTNFLNTTVQAIQFVRKLNQSGIGINIDIGTMIYNREGIELLEENMDLINHIHISEPNLVPIEIKDLHSQVAQSLRKCNYQNFISIEMKKT